ncbi:hypothetical protein B0H14DRAFT_2635053 [Mycena olivaceomarginata]|nr:hypothetical protein B0H14DRAFT_2635053 [Mycena olivaceomarginata]
MEKRAGGNGSESGAGAQPQVPRMRLEEYWRVLEDFRREVGSNQEQRNKGKGETFNNPSLRKTPVAQKTRSLEYHQRRCSLDLEPESGRDSDRGLSEPEAEPEDSLGGVVVKGRG